jgi:hypothetical protein
MRPVLKSILAILFIAPMAAQSPTVASLLGQDHAGCLVYIGEPKGELFNGLQDLIGTDELVEMDIALAYIQTTSPSFAKVANELNLSPDSLWALTDPRGRRLIQGDGLPSAEALLDALAEAGVKSPMAPLRDFLKGRPDHLDARAQLLHMLRKTAETRTLRALKIATEPPAELGREKDSQYWYRLWSKHPSIDMGAVEGKTLSPERDTEIWGDYARELQAVFENGDWRLLKNLPSAKRRVPAEACSQTMVQIYARHLSQIEAHIEEYPSREHLWQHYAWACAITKQGSARALLERLLPPPGLERRWPPDSATGLLIAQEREKGDWEFLAEALWAGWPEFRLFARNPVNRFPRLTEMTDAQMIGYLEILWQDSLRPLLESLIKANRAEDAEAVMLDMSSLRINWNFKHTAASLAKACGRDDLRAKWTAMKMPGKPSGLDMDDLEAALGAMCQDAPAIVLTSGDMLYMSGLAQDERLATLNAVASGGGRDIVLSSLVLQDSSRTRSGSARTDTMTKRGKAVDWRLAVKTLDWQISELMHTRENWRKGERHWALIGTDRVTLGGGPGLPTEKDLLQALERSAMEPTAQTLRRFVSEHPGQMEAKGLLLAELKRVAELKAAETLGQRQKQVKRLLPKEEMLNKLADVLTDEEDGAIWGEYAALCQQALPLLMECAQPYSDDNPYMNLMLFSSNAVKRVANPLLSQIEENLRRRPMDEFLWGQWALLSGLGEQSHFGLPGATAALDPFTSLSGVGERSRFGYLKNSFALSPLNSPLNFPPIEQRRQISIRYMSIRNWQGVVDLHEWHWEAKRDDAPNMGTGESVTLAVTTGLPLLMAYLYLEKDNHAEAVVEVLRRTPLWKIYKEIVVDYAKECGKPALAKRWKKLK